MLDTSERKFLSHLKILAADFNRFSFVKLYVTYISSFLHTFCLGQLSLQQKETDGPVSALLLTDELETCQYLTYL